MDEKEKNSKVTLDKTAKESPGKTTETQSNSRSKIIISILVSVIITALVVGALSYLFFNNKEEPLQPEIDRLSSENKILKTEIEELKEQIKKMELKDEEDMDDEDSSEDTEEDDSLPTDTFMFYEDENAYYGRLIATGYVTTEEVSEPFCDTDCATYTYVTLNITSTENAYIDDFLDLNTGNSFTGVRKIGIGCVEEGILSRSNDSDDYGMQEYTSSPADSSSILTSTLDDPVTLELERYLYTSGRGAPACYSHFAEVGVVE